jgi:hypothetical protein
LILLTLLSHQWKSFWRSRSAGKSIAVQIIMGLVVLYFLSVAIGAGIFLKEFIHDSFPKEDPVRVFSGGILYYFSFDILMRFMWQDLPTLTIQPYLIQNIRRSQLIRFLNIRSLFNVINLLPPVLALPFILRQIGPEYGETVMLAFVVSILFLTAFNHFFILYIKRKTILNSWWMVGFFLVVALFGLGDYYHVFSLSHASEIVFIQLISRPALCLMTVVLAIGAFVNNYYFLYNNLYLEDIGKKDKRKTGADYAFLDRFGAIGELIALEIKLMLRNKRPRTILIMSGVFIFYGFIFYKPQYIEHGRWGFLLVGAVFVTGIFISNYGQFLFAWQSGNFDGLMSCRLSVRIFIKSKFVLFTVVCTTQLLLATFYGLLSWKLIPLQVAAYFYNIGIQSVVAVYFATRSYKAIDITRKAAFNYQGLGASQWIYVLLIFAIPVLIYLPFEWLGDPWTGVLVLGVIGLISLLLQEWWIGILSREFVKRKYLILEGFREK